jgi:hypothetical protein
MIESIREEFVTLTLKGYKPFSQKGDYALP